MRHGSNKEPDEKFIRRRLENEEWLTTQRENERNYEQVATPLKWSGILTFVIDYQNKHRGMSPTDLMISHATKLSPGQVQYHLRAMEVAGLIRDHRGWPRRISVESAAKVQSMTQIETQPTEKVKEVKTMDSEVLQTAAKKVLGPTGRKAFMERAKALGQAVIDHYDQYGVPPDGAYLKEHVYGRVTAGGGLSRVTEQMVALGWLYHKHGYHRDYALTGLGRAALFGQIGEQLHPDTPINPPENNENKQLSEGSRRFWASLSPEERAARGRHAANARWQKPSIPRDVMPSQRGGFARAAQQSPLVMAEVRRAVAPTPKEELVSLKTERFVATPSQDTAQNYSITGMSDVDLIIELTRRGFKVSR